MHSGRPSEHVSDVPNHHTMPSESTATIISHLLDSPTQTDQEIITPSNSSFQEILCKTCPNKAKKLETNELSADNIMHGSTVKDDTPIKCFPCSVCCQTQTQHVHLSCCSTLPIVSKERLTLKVKNKTNKLIADNMKHFMQTHLLHNQTSASKDIKYAIARENVGSNQLTST